jgi:hypothetical protein
MVQARAAVDPLYAGGTAPSGGATGGGADPTIEMHKAANDQAKQAGQQTYMLNGVEYNVQ